jgi:hypothetical protein
MLWKEFASLPCCFALSSLRWPIRSHACHQQSSSLSLAAANDKSGYCPKDIVLSLPLKRNFQRQSLPPDGVSHRYRPSPSLILLNTFQDCTQLVTTSTRTFFSR